MMKHYETLETDETLLLKKICEKKYKKTAENETDETLETYPSEIVCREVYKDKNNDSGSRFLCLYSFPVYSHIIYVSSVLSVSNNNINNTINNRNETLKSQNETLSRTSNETNETLETLPLPNLKINLQQLNKILYFIAGRTDYYWEYSKRGVPFLKKVNKEDKKGTPLTLNELLKHFIGTLTHGFSPFIDCERIIFGGLDFDAHTSNKLSDEENNKLIEEAQSDALKVYEFLKSLNLPVILNSSGSKGRHVRLCCPEAKAKDIRIFLKYVLKKVCNDSDKHEIFPKQDNLTDERPFGNQMKGMLGIHPKTKQRANVILNGTMLDLDDSINYICGIVDKLNTFSPIKMSEEDYIAIEQEEKQKRIIEILNDSKIDFTSEGKVPLYCAFLEEIASKNPLPSGGKYNRHACLDPNVASYGIKHFSVKKNYAIQNERTINNGILNTAFDNWSKYWNGEPVFKCSQIIGYLKHYAKKDNNYNKLCFEGLKKCVNCKQFKRFLEKKNTPKGWARSLIISEIAKKEELSKCPKCNNAFNFNDNKGMFYCKTCKQGGGLKLFVKLCLLKNKGILNNLNKNKQESKE